MDLVDPHCHFWDVSDDSPSGHKRKIDSAKSNNYYLSDYIGDISSTGFSLKKVRSSLFLFLLIGRQFSSKLSVKILPKKVLLAIIGYFLTQDFLLI